jgi:hypothetical protein
MYERGQIMRREKAAKGNMWEELTNKMPIPRKDGGYDEQNQ